MAYWLRDGVKYCMCSKCRYTWDDRIDHVSDLSECPNCGSTMEPRLKFFRWSSDLSGGIVIATSMEDALEKLENKYANVREKIRNFTIWRWDEDDYYDEENPNVLDIYE